MYSDLNDFLADLDKRRLLTRVSEPVSPDLEIAAVTDRACKMPGGGPALLFEKPTGFDMPVATNVFGSLERMCLALGVKTLDDLGDEIDELMTPPMPAGIMDALKMLPMVSRLSDLMPKTVKDAPCQEVVRRDGTLDELPILKCWPEDGGRFITLPLVFTKDPETGMRNIGTYRMQVFDGRTTGMHWQRHKGGAQHHRVAERLGKRLEVAVALSPEPVLTYCATAPMPEGLDELLLGGFLARRRIEMVKCVTVDLEVPASSHIVLEGYVEPGERRREGPFGDHTGFYSQPDDYPVFHLTCITRRKRPTYLTTIVGIPPMEDFYLGHGERADLPADDPEDGARDRRHALSGRRHLPQPRHHLDRQALSGSRPQDHERVLGPRPVPGRRLAPGLVRQHRAPSPAAPRSDPLSSHPVPPGCVATLADGVVAARDHRVGRGRPSASSRSSEESHRSLGQCPPVDAARCSRGKPLASAAALALARSRPLPVRYFIV